MTTPDPTPPNSPPARPGTRPSKGRGVGRPPAGDGVEKPEGEVAGAPAGKGGGGRKGARTGARTGARAGAGSGAGTEAGSGAGTGGRRGARGAAARKDATEAGPPEGGPATEPGSVLLVERRGAVTVLTLNRPDRLNAVTLELYRELGVVLASLAREPGARPVVLTGAGRAFCVGADLRAHGEAEPDAAHRRRYVRAAQRANRAIQRYPWPVVAAVNGHAIGAGLELALSSDLIVMAGEARLRLPEVSLGTFLGGGVTYTLPALVGQARARELILLGRFFSAEEALSMGMANEVLPSPRVLERGVELAEALAAQAPIPLREAKRLLRTAPRRSHREAMAAEERVLLRCMQTDDWAEGIRAFHEKRPPSFHGR